MAATTCRDVDESDGEDALTALGEATLDALDAAAKDRVLRDGVGATIGAAGRRQPQNLRLALEKRASARIRLESGVVEADLRLKPSPKFRSADDVGGSARGTRGSKAAATVAAPADKDARRAAHDAAAFRACASGIMAAEASGSGPTRVVGVESPRRRGDAVVRERLAWIDLHAGETKTLDGPHLAVARGARGARRWPLVEGVLEKRNAEAFAVIQAAGRLGLPAARSDGRVGPPRVTRQFLTVDLGSRAARRRAASWRASFPKAVPEDRRRDAVAALRHRAGAQRRPVAGQHLPAPRAVRRRPRSSLTRFAADPRCLTSSARSASAATTLMKGRRQRRGDRAGLVARRCGAEAFRVVCASALSGCDERGPTDVVQNID